MLARAEWDEDFDEGLMLDMQGRVIAATAANVFVRRGRRWLTPPVDQCGIAGVARSKRGLERLREMAKNRNALLFVAGVGEQRAKGVERVGGVRTRPGGLRREKQRLLRSK